MENEEIHQNWPRWLWPVELVWLKILQTVTCLEILGQALIDPKYRKFIVQFIKNNRKNP